MEVEKVIEAVRPRIRDARQEERIRQLAQRIDKAFEQQRGQGVKEELGRDWDALKKQFDAVLKKLQKETGLY